MGTFMDPKLFLKLAPERRQIMGFVLRQSMEVLQMPQMEFHQWLQEEVEKNPLLELRTRAVHPDRIEELASPLNLHEHVLTQIRDQFEFNEDREVAEQFFNCLDERGFLVDLPEKLIPFCKVMLPILQTFDPPGIFARDLREALLIQLRAKGKEMSPAVLVVEGCFDDLLHARYKTIEKKLKIANLAPIIRELAGLSMRPVSSFKQGPICHVKPDLRIEQIDGGWTLEILEDVWPEIRTEYLTVDTDPEEKAALTEFKTKARTVFRAVEQRRELLRAIGRQFIKKQWAYLSEKGPLVKLTAKELAERLEVHESTLSRAMSGKYISTPRGILPLKTLVTAAPATVTAKDLLQQLIQTEDKNKPLTDEQLADALKSQGFPVARRTIAKYRTQLRVGTASQRKRR